MRVVVGHENVVAPAARNLDRGEIGPGGREQAGCLGLRGQVGVEAEHDIGLGRCAFQLQAVEQGNAVRDRNEFDVAAAFGLESLLDLRAGTPFGGEALIGVDGQFFLRGGRKGQSGQA